MAILPMSACVIMLLLVTATSAAPAKKHQYNIRTCSRFCRVPKDSKFRYFHNQVYDYSYQVKTSTYMSHSPRQSTQLVIDAFAQIHVISTCEMVLKLREVRITETDPIPGKPHRNSANARVFREQLEKQPLRFAFQDGWIADVCPALEETVWALNVKRGFLTAFQNRMKKLDRERTVAEVGVLGTCPTVYHITGSGWFSKTVKKSRDLSKCSRKIVDQSDNSELLQTVLTGHQDCDQAVDWNGILISATCVERHHFRPVPGQTDGPVTEVLQTIKFLQKRDRAAYSPPLYKRLSLEYDSLGYPNVHRASHDEEAPTDIAFRKVKGILRELCTQSEVLPETTDLFFDLVANVRKIGGPSLRILQEKVLGASFCYDQLRIKNYFVDALSMAGTEASLRVLAKVVTSRHHGVDTLKAWLLLTSLAFLPNVTSGMLEVGKKFLDYKPLSLTAMLPVSSMVHTYCQEHGGCDVSPDVQRIMLHFRRAIGTQCYANSNNAATVLVALRAIGNAGHVTYITEVLDNCLKRGKNPLDVRVAAAEAFRRVPCSAGRERAQLIFEDTAEPSELRIAAYQTVMLCARKSDFLTLQRVLAAEPDSQLLSFVFTHLKNLVKNDDTFREETAAVFRNVDVTSKELGRLLLSRHFTGNISDYITFDASLVLPSSESLPPSSLSWIPRSSTASLVLDFMGKKVDLAEIGVRGEGLEFIVENIFLPLLGKRRPYVGPKKMQEKLKKLKGSLFTRILGKEVSFLQMSESTNSVMQQLATGKFFDARQLLAKLSAEGKASLSQNMVLLNQTTTVPTSCGLPLTVTVNSTVSALLNVSGSFDVSRALSRPKALYVDLSIHPSASLRVTGTMSVDAMVTRSSLRMTGTLHSNVVMKGRVQVDRTKLFRWELDVPRDKMIIFDARTEMTFIYKNKEHPILLSEADRPELNVCSGRTGITLLGLDLCGEVRLPHPTPSLSDLVLRPSSLAVILYKKDTLSQYKFSFEHSKTASSVKTQMSFATPGSDVDRTFELYFNGNLKQRKLELRMISPWKNIGLSGAVLLTPRVKGVRCMLTVDDVVAYRVIAEVSVKKSRVGLTYRPMLELRHPGVTPVIASGSLSVGRFGRTVSFDVSLSGVHRITPILKGAWMNSKREISVRASASLGTENSYSFACGSYVTVSGRRTTNTELSPFLYINTPSSQLISLSGRGDYRQGRSLRADVKLLTEWTRPLLVQYGMVRTPSKTQTHYKVNARIESSVAMVTMDTRASVKAWSSLLARMTFSHDIPLLLPKDTFSIATKLAGRYTSELRNILIQSQLESKEYSHYNYDVKVLGEWRPPNSLLKVFCANGINYKLNKNYMSLTSKLRHHVRDWRHVSLLVSGTMKVPSENFYVGYRASHSHNPRALETKGFVSYGDNQQSQAKLILGNKSAKFLRIVGKALLYLPDEKRRGKRKKVPSFQLQMRISENEDIYEITAGAHAGRKKRDFLSIVVIQKPVSLRRIQMYSKGIPYYKAYQDYEAEFTHTMHPLLADIIEDALARRWALPNMAKSLRLLGTVGGATLLNNASVLDKDAGKDNSSWSWDSEAGTAKLKHLFSALEDGEIWAVDGSRLQGPGKMDVRGGVDYKSSFVDLTSRSLDFFHTYNLHDHRTDVTFVNNGEEYKYRMDVSDNLAGWLQRSNGTMALKSPKKHFAAEWNHQLELDRVRSTFGSTWWKNRQFYFDLNSQMHSTSLKTEMFADVVLQSSWKPVRDWRFSVGHGSTPSFVRSKSSVRRNGVRMTSHDVLLMHTSAVTDATVVVFTPVTREISGSLISQHDVYPVSGTLQLQWNPRQKVSVKTTASLETWDNAEGSVHWKSTLPGLNVISADVSNKMENGNLVSKMTGRYGRKLIMAESSIRRDDFLKARLIVLTPFEYFLVLDTGFQVDGDIRHFSSKANFKLHPIIKKYDASLAWSYEDKFSGKFRLDTPLEDFSYVQLVARSETKGKYQTAELILKHHPFQVYSCDVAFTSHTPEEITMTLKTPHYKYDKFVIQLLRDRMGSRISRVTVNVHFPPNQQDIVAVGLVSVAGGVVHGNFSVRTPFPGLEQTGVSFVHSHSGRELSTRVNITADCKQAAVHALLAYAGDVGIPDSTTHDVIWTDRMLLLKKQLQSLRKMHISFRSGTTQHHGANRLVDDESPERNTKSTALLSYDGSTHQKLTRVQFVVPFMEALEVYSKYTRQPEDRSVGLSATYGSMFSFNGTTTVSLSHLESGEQMYPRSGSMALRALNRHREYFNSLESSDKSFTLDRINGVSIHLETKLPFLSLDQYNIYTHVKKNSRGVISSEIINSVELKDKTSVTIDIHGWAKSSHKDTVGMSLEAGHVLLADLFKTYLRFNSSLRGENKTFFMFRTDGSLNNITGAVQMNLREDEVLHAKVRHIHRAGLFNSSIIVKNNNFDHLTLAVGYVNHQQDIATNLSLGIGNTLSMKGLLVNKTNHQGMRTLKSALEITSALTRNVVNVAEVQFHPRDPWSNVRASIQAQHHNKLGNINVTLGRETCVSVLARVEESTGEINPDLDKLAREVQFMYNSTQKRFKSSIFVGQQDASPYEGMVDIKYDTLLNLDSKASLRSPLRFAEDLSLEIHNHGNYYGENRAQLSFGWAPYRAISLDATSSHRPSVLGVAHKTEVFVITPFQDFQTGSMKLRHSRVLAKTNSSMETKVNGRVVLNLGLSSNDPSVLGVKQSFLNFFQKSAVGFSPQEKSHRGHAFVHWDLSNPDSEVRIDTALRMSMQNVPIKHRDFSFKVSRSRRAFAVKYRTQRSANSATGEGEIKWDEDANTDKKVFYSYSGMRERLLSASKYRGHVKVGCPVRCVEANGSVVTDSVGTGPLESALHGGGADQESSLKAEGVIFWDALRDRRKHLTLTSAIVRKERLSAEVSFAIPLISQEYRLKTSLLANTRNTVWDSSTSFSFTPDPTETVTFTSTILNTSSTSGQVIGYSMATSLTQPSSDLDVGLTSRIGRNESAYVGEFEGWYMDSQRQNRTLAGSGVLHHLSQKMNATVRTQSTEMSLEAEVPPSIRSHTLDAKGHVRSLDAQAADLGGIADNQFVLHTELDPFHRYFVVNVYGIDPNRVGALETWYVNDSAIRAEVYRTRMTGSVTDSVLALRLNTSTMLHVRLSWRPETAQELQAHVASLQSRVDDFKLRAMQTLLQTRRALEREVTLKHAAVMTTMAREAASFFDLLETEKVTLEKQLESLSREINNLLEVNDKYLQILAQLFGEVGDSLADRLRRLSATYPHTFNMWVNALSDEMVNSEMVQHYLALIEQIGQQIEVAGRHGNRKLDEFLTALDLYLLHWKDRLQEIGSNVYSLDDLYTYVDDAREELNSLHMPRIYEWARDRATTWLAPLSTASPVMAVSRATRELYSQAVWVYRYVYVSTHSHRHLDSIAGSLRDIVLAEIRFRLRHFQFLRKSRVTVWLPERGEAQAEVCLPFPVRSLLVTQPEIHRLWMDIQSDFGK